MKDPIFIVGLSRSGSTLWHNIISMNQEIFRLTEMRFLTPFHKDFSYFLKTQIGNLSEEKNLVDLVDKMFSKRQIKGLSGAFWRFENINGINDNKLKNIIIEKIKDSKKSLGDIFTIFINELTYYNGYNRCCVKFPVYVNHVPELLKWYPKCKIIHITRDPRAIAMSRTNDPGGTAILINKHPKYKLLIKKIMVYGVIFQYIWTSILHQKYRDINNYKLFKYEDLLSNPEKTLKNLCEFINIDFLPDMIHPHKGRHEHQSSSITGKKQKSFDKYAAVRWVELISPHENFLISNLTKSSMARFNYNPDIHPIFSLV